MGKHNKPTTDEKPKLLKPIHAAKLVDKNARTIAKMMQLLDATQRATSSAIDNETHTAQRLEKLTNRLNRRLTTLARWADNPVIDRETPDMRATYGRHQPGNYAIKSSYGGYVPMPAPPLPLYPAQQQYRMVPAPGITQSSSSQVAAGIQQQSNVAKTGGEGGGEEDDDHDEVDDEDDEGEGAVEGKEESGPGTEDREGDDDDDDDDGDDDDEDGDAMGQESQDNMNDGPQIQIADNHQGNTAGCDDDDGDDEEYNEAKGDGEEGGNETQMDVVSS